MGPPQTHWIAPMIFSFLVGLANFAIYYSSVDYMIAAYGPYSASATGKSRFRNQYLSRTNTLQVVMLSHETSLRVYPLCTPLRFTTTSAKRAPQNWLPRRLLVCLA